MDGFIACFEDLEDPRTGNAGRHDLLEILMIALCTVLCGGQSAVDMAEFAEDKECCDEMDVPRFWHGSAI